MNILGFDIFAGRSTRLKQFEQFQKVMDIANDIVLVNPVALKDLVRALLRPLQSELIVAVAEYGNYQAPKEIEGASFFFPDRKIFSYSKHFCRDAPKIELNLAYDPILPTPWRRDRFVKALATIGSGKVQGGWKQSSNHVVSLLLPWGIGFVGGGNHSISSGILSGENIPIIAAEVYDFGSVLDIIECDGVTYRNRHTKMAIAEVNDYRKAAVFEIGRLMLQHQVLVGTIRG